jgi:hypothetical protein
MEIAMKAPQSVMKDKFGDKKKLVAAVEKFTGDDLWVARTNKDKGLAHVSNAKLLRLHATFSAVKEKFGTRAKLIDAIVTLEKRTKDAGYKTRLEAYPVPRLWDMYRSVEKRNKPAEKPAAKAPAKKAKAATAEKKAPAAKKTSTKAKAAAKKK